MAPTYPRTVSGLLAALAELCPADIESAAAALDGIADRIAPRRLLFPPGISKREQMDYLLGRVAPYRPPGYRQPSAHAEHTARVARHLAFVLRQIPRLRGALRSLTAETAEPVSTAPLAIPDPVAAIGDVDEMRDAGTGEVLSLADEPDGVFWWPSLSAAAVQVGFTQLADVPADDLVVHHQYPGSMTGGRNWGPGNHQPSLTLDIVYYAETMSRLRGRGAGWHEFARGMRGGGHHAAARNQARSTALAYRDWITLLHPVGDRLAGDWAAAIETTWTALEALTATQGENMPTLTGTSAVVGSLATRIRAAIDSGHGGRLAVSDDGGAFSWQPAPGATLLGHLNPATVTGRHATIVNARNAATVVGPVAEGGTKPTVVDFTSREIDLVKYAGLAKMSTESAQFVSNVEAAVSSVLVSQITRAIEKDAVTAITAEAGISITAAADMTAGVLAGIAGVRENGGAPTVVALASADWLEVMTATGGNGYLNWSSPEAGPGGTWLGLIPVIVPGMTAGTALVIDGSSVSVLEPAGGPLCVVDVYSGLSVNSITIAVEEWATTQVTSPGGVAAVATTP